ncbi:MAG: phytanoyl-CoA dioxygenase family protein [Archangium sp.]|nr:phytanoyl-CoA dioxygenase family protein [Archangium sp.]MDP3575344.1 phytanoyl-CoA dioxygenase family protein [Archangium sp.]
MPPRVESRSFPWHSAEAKAFFDAHGYAVVDRVLTDDSLDQINRGWNEVVHDSAVLAGLSPTSFVERFPQNRDLWRKNEQFRTLLFDTEQSAVVRRFLGAKAVRLFHDQAICKPPGRSGAIPWHQDSAYWPLDRVGLSVWTPTADVPTTGGCLKVIDGSHRDGPAPPQDFLANRGVARDCDARLVLLPTRRGQSVILDGLTWHASDPNGAVEDRLAYLTLWVPAAARFVPAHANWHPSSAHIHVAPGERLEGEYFPLFGDAIGDEESSGRLVSFPAPMRANGPSMFTASKDIAAQIAWLRGSTGAPSPLSEQLGTTEQLASIISRLVECAVIKPNQQGAVLELLVELRQQELVRRVSVARDVYLRAVSRWWEVAGSAIEVLQRVPS